jgi:anti-sigma B factor antagonist
MIPPQLVIDRDHRLGIATLKLRGELDLASSPLLTGELEDLEASGARRLVVDLSGLEFMDSTGLHSLLAALERSRTNGHELSLRRGPRSVHQIFELTGTVSAFRFED